MIAFAIACLLAAATIIAALSATDSLLRGWHTYRQLRAELRAVRADAAGTSDAPTTDLPRTRGPNALGADRRGPARVAPHCASSPLRAAA